MLMYNLTNIHMLRLFNIENVLSQVAELPVPVSSTPIRQIPAKQIDDGILPSMLQFVRFHTVQCKIYTKDST